MHFQKIGKLFFAVLILNGIFFSAVADTIEDPCAGPNALLNIVDRPTVGDSACVVPFKKAIVETGYQNMRFQQSSGNLQNFPEATFRLGLPARNEFIAILPNYIHQTIEPFSGFTTAVMGIKHELGYTKHWLATIEGIVTLPGGSNAFGSSDTGAAVNGILNYTLNSKVSFSFMLGATTQTQSRNDGGERFTSINPDLVMTYVFTKKINFYGEVYGQSKTGPGQGSGFNGDAGVIYLLFPNVTVDLEAGHRISGMLGNFGYYIGAGAAIMFL